jgi:hypothetical protein
LEDIIKDINEIKENEGKELVHLAKEAIKEYLKSRRIIDLEKIPYENWKKKGASFVTLEIKETGQLRGCIGSIIPYKPLYQDVIHNAIAAATKDPRFPPVVLEELPLLRTKVSILSFPKKLEYDDYRDLLNKLKPFEDGVILKIGEYQGTFLPDVWQQIPDKESFLSHLCLKAGLTPDCWIKYHPEIYTYRTRIFND